MWIRRYQRNSHLDDRVKFIVLKYVYTWQLIYVYSRDDVSYALPISYFHTMAIAYWRLGGSFVQSEGNGLCPARRRVAQGFAFLEREDARDTSRGGLILDERHVVGV